MICDLCGAKTELLFKTSIENSELNVCKACSVFGKVISEVRIEEAKPKKAREEAQMQSPEKELIFVITADYAEKIKKKREELGLKQEDFAKIINEKQALVHKMETGHFEPNIDLARKLERFLKIKLIEQYEETHDKAAREKTGTFTIGDFTKVKK